MWGFASDAIYGNAGPKNEILKPNTTPSECSDDEISAEKNREEGLECQICWESFNIVENVPYVLWCGHTICKNCILGLKWAIVKLPPLPVQLPFFISCPWCSCLSFRLVYKGIIKLPRRNYFLLWMVENMNGGMAISHFSLCSDQPVFASNKSVDHVKSACVAATSPDPKYDFSGDGDHTTGIHLNTERFHFFLRKSLVLLFNLTAKFPLVFLFLLSVLYVIPASVIILVVYILITVLFVIPASLVLYFAFPFLRWLGRGIMS
ncbi:hypothetical protein DCAR_0624742 [Daucus carota subsp. sativus]|uniref:RING-type domain-containing protein n=1 Tax=Daucus carota subsp. sativus TaxID=79200 RepID=A0AAF0XFD6_DAUCS|nr:PREDICTED: E3 ubiquitin-protein ligase RNF182-like [Daucus carota subsp. sativus]WOH05326.1 hypothetical protein DCAR_0624742 [Daucus carota subsp. sativus]